ncbi:MAG: co-chaperone GroES [Deltaproteobacteria bacterium]|nr:co-chaperone GroES [Deltaproteobacteria bacterium]
MKIRPLHDRVIVKRVDSEKKTKGGLYIPDTAKEKPIEGTVLAAGNGKILEDGSVRKLEVKAGDRVLFGKYSGTEDIREGIRTCLRKRSFSTNRRARPFWRESTR